MNLSEHFTLQEAIFSHTANRLGIENEPSEYVLANLKYTASKMERIRAALGNVPIKITSWYRSPELNKAIKGSKTSQHILGEAVDFICPSFGTPEEICKKIISIGPELIPFDQLIYEHTWVHISFTTTKKPRREILTLLSSGNYTQGICDKKGNPL